jgi:hypothetical protein
MGAPPQEVLDQQILDDADILIGIFGTRIGTPTEEYISGTVEEIKRHCGAGKTAKVYFSDAPIQPSLIDPRQYDALQAFKEECKTGGLYATYESLDSFKELFPQHLAIELNSPRYLWVAAPASQSETSGQPSFSEEAKRALVAASEGDGNLIHFSDLSGETVRAGNEVLTDGTVRSVAIWKEVLRELEANTLIEQSTFDSGVYRLTGSGFRVAEKLRLEGEERKQLEIELKIAGTAISQTLEIVSNKTIRVRQIEFLTTSGVSIAQQDLDLEREVTSLPVKHENTVKLFNTPRSDMNRSDRSGPATIRFTYSRKGVTNSLDLPVMLQPVFVHSGMGSTQYISLSGQKRFYL